MDTRNSSIFKEKETLARFLCPSCRCLLQDPIQPSCGHRLCKPCADTIIDNECPPCCPLEDCQEEFTTEDGASLDRSRICFLFHDIAVNIGYSVSEATCSVSECLVSFISSIHFCFYSVCRYNNNLIYRALLVALF